MQPPVRGSGGKGIRTPGLFIANEALYQLSYTPEFRGDSVATPPRNSTARRRTVSLRGTR